MSGLVMTAAMSVVLVPTLGVLSMSRPRPPGGRHRPTNITAALRWGMR